MNVRIFQINVFCTSACRYVKKILHFLDFWPKIIYRALVPEVSGKPYIVE